MNPHACKDSNYQALHYYHQYYHHRRKLHVNAGNFTPQETSCQCRKLYTAGNFPPQETFRRKKPCVYAKLPCVKLSFPIKNARPCRASILSFCFTSRLRDSHNSAAFRSSVTTQKFSYGRRPSPPSRVIVSPVIYLKSGVANCTHTRPMLSSGSPK